ncbi:MAG: adenylyl-sulfate kinase [Arenicella sp.]
MSKKSTNVVWQHPTVTRSQRESLNQHKGSVLWLTGLSGAGKSTMAIAVESALHKRNIRTIVLDGDNIRHGLCSDLGFSDSDRKENIRRIGETAKLFMEAGVIVITAFISPFRSDRQTARSLVAQEDFNEIYCKCSLEVCESRDVKGLYKKARAGEIKDFTGISSPYEEPENAQVIIDTDALDVEQSVTKIINFLEESGVISSKT